MNYGNDDNFAYRNPNYNLPSSSSESASVAEGTVSGEEELNLVDTHYVSLETLSEADANRLKSRSKYAQLGVSDMGVPTSPIDSSPERLPHLSAAIERVHNIHISGRSDDQLDSGLGVNGSFTSDRSGEFIGVRRLGDRNPQLGGSSYSLNADSLLSGTSARNFVAQQQQQQEQNFGERRLRRTSVDNLLLTGDDNSSMNGHENDTSVDYSHHDFRSSFAVIDQAAKGGNINPGGIRVKKQGDTTVVTEHRDPYSFYWQLDQLRRQSPPPEPAVQGENVIEEMITTDNTAQVQSPDSHDSGIQVEYVRPSKPVKKPTKRWEPPPAPQPKEESPKRKLPQGWERHEDASGFSYYWHVDSGTIQREAPPEPQLPPIQRAKVEEAPPLYLPKVTLLQPNPQPPPEAVRVKQTPPAADRIVHVERPIVVERQVQLAPQQPVIVERAFKQTTTKRRVENDTSDDKELEEGSVGKPVRFAVRSLGWTEIAEEDLTPERSSRAVNRAIVDLSTGRNDLIDNVSKWGDGKELIMELDDRDLRLLDPDSGALLHTQPIHQIRVWGVGRDNGRDFAYVARDRSSRRFMCHVFRCDTPARTIANTLRDICKRLMIEKRPTTLATAATNGGPHESRKFNASSRPTASGPPSHSQQRSSGQYQSRRSAAQATSFPTPMEEPKKVIRCHFLGVTQVPKATGVEILNEAVDRLVGQVRQERWILVDVGIAPSTITITEVGGNQITECRVRYLSFLGIGRDIKHCAFIMHTSSETFMCYVFHVEPSAGAMAKTIEAACKLRYQKVLDSHGERRTQNGGKTWGDSIRDVFGSLSGRRSNRSSQYPR